MSKFNSTRKPRNSQSYPTPFSTRNGVADAFDRLFKKFANSILIVSYSSNSLPTQDEMVAIMARYKQHVEVIPIDYKYCLAIKALAKNAPGIPYRNTYSLDIGQGGRMNAKIDIWLVGNTGLRNPNRIQ